MYILLRKQCWYLLMQRLIWIKTVFLSAILVSQMTDGMTLILMQGRKMNFKHDKEQYMYVYLKKLSKVLV